MSYPFNTKPYNEMQKSWPPTGRHILATYSETSIVLYQAYKPSIADYAVANQTFLNCPDFKLTRMTWLKPNFLWMMYRSGWATKENQERILAITISREGFEEILRLSCSTSKPEADMHNQDCKKSEVLLQWDPDHHPHGNKLERRAIQLGLRCAEGILQRFFNEFIIRIDDVTDFVNEQYKFVLSKELDKLQVPEEKVYTLMDSKLAEHIGLDTLP